MVLSRCPTENADSVRLDTSINGKALFPRLSVSRPAILSRKFEVNSAIENGHK